MKPKFTMLAGLPASGKSTYAIKLSLEDNAVIHSSDRLREILYRDENCQEKNNELFTTLHRRIKNDLKDGNSVIYDATNISYRRRMSFLKELKKIECEKVCVIVATPYEMCLIRNQERDRKVPEHVIKKMYMNWNTPYWYEGWDDIQIKYTHNPFLPPLEFWYQNRAFNQHNKYHTLSLGEHCAICEYNLRNLEAKPVMCEAALLHDCGKPFTKTFKNMKDQITEDAHYYQHHCVGAYDSLFYMSNEDKLERAVLVQWHMQPYFWEKENNEKQRLKYKKLWGDELYEDIMLLHDADKQSH